MTTVLIPLRNVYLYLTLCLSNSLSLSLNLSHSLSLSLTLSHSLSLNLSHSLSLSFSLYLSISLYLSLFVFQPGLVSLRAASVVVQGELRAGSEGCRFQGQAEVLLTGQLYLQKNKIHLLSDKNIKKQLFTRPIGYRT